MSCVRLSVPPGGCSIRPLTQPSVASYGIHPASSQHPGSWLNHSSILSPSYDTHPSIHLAAAPIGPSVPQPPPRAELVTLMSLWIFPWV